ncbi:hypothetical protein BGZ52_009706 [Haplosporangium bisporale]|nr:hypothetical protein BGZ52_009706 [Haplosporangium bisporale]
MFLLAVADLVASSIEHSSPKSLLAAPTPSMPHEQINHHINNRIIPPGLCGSLSIVELAPETYSTTDRRTEFGKRQVSAPWSTASQPPPGESSIPTTTTSSTTITTLASTTSSNPQTTTSPQSSLRPNAPIPDTPRPPVKPYLLTDFEYETMWNPDYNSLRLGVLLPFSAKATERQALLVRKTMSAMRLAVQDANQQRLIPGLNLTIVVRDSQDPNQIISNGGAAAITGAGSLLSVKVSAVIGDISSDLTRYEALMTSSVQIPQCSFASVNTILSDEIKYPYFFRTISTTIVLLDAILDVIRAAGWNRISLIFDIDTMGWAATMGIFILAYQPLTIAGVPYDPTFESVKNMIHSSQSRIQVVIATGPILGIFLTAMRNEGLFGPEYAWVTMTKISDVLRLQADVKDYDGLIMVDNGWELSGYEPFETFLSEWMALNPQDYPGAGDPELDNYEGMAYSCVMMLAQAYGQLVNNSIPAGEISERRDLFLQELMVGEHTEEIKMVNYFCNTTYRGPSGPITLDQNGDRKEGPTFCLCELLGIFLVLVWCITHVGLPTKAVCAARIFIIPIGTTLLAGSLTIKNYRIYRIFDSVTVANQSFQTRKLLRYLVVAVILSAVPIIVEIIVDPPFPEVTNIRAYQWDFPLEIYLATFYITIVGTYIVAMLSLIVLFSPKIWILYKNRHKWARDNHASQSQGGCIGPMGGGGGGGGIGNMTATLARLPGDFGTRQDTATKMGIPDLDMAGMNGGTGEHGSDPITVDKVLLPITGSSSHGALQRMLSTDSGISRRSRRSINKLEANPLGAWMKTKVPQKGMVPSIDGTSTSYLMLAMTQLRSETEPTLRVTTCHSGSLLIRFSTQERLDGWMSLFSEEDLQDLAGSSSSTSSLGATAPGLPSFAHGASGRLHNDLNSHGIGMFGPGVSLSSDMNDFHRQVRQQQQQQRFDGGFHQYSGRRVGGSHDLLASMMSGPDQGQRPESSQKRQSWTARLGFSNPMSRLWNNKESSKSTSDSSDHYSNYCGDIDENLPAVNTARLARSGGEWTSTDSNMTTVPVRGDRKVDHALRENETVLEDDGEGDDDMKVLESSSKLAKKSTVKGNDLALSEGIRSVSLSEISPISPDTPESLVHGDSGTLKIHDTLTPKEGDSASNRDESPPPVSGDKSMTDTPDFNTIDSPVASDTNMPVSKTHPAGVTCLSVCSLATNESSGSCLAAQRMMVRPLPPGNESGDAFYEDAVLSDSDEPTKRKITDMDLHPSREFCKHAKRPPGMTAVLSLPQIDFLPRKSNKPQTSKAQYPKQPPVPLPIPQPQEQKPSSTPAPNHLRQAKFSIVPQLEPRSGSPALTRLLHANHPDDIDDDDSDDDLYDPEFGIGPASGHRQRRRRNQFKLSRMSSSASSIHAVIPSADVISAAAKAVSQGWSESDALHMAMMGNPPVNNNNNSPTTPSPLSRSSSRVSRAQKQQPSSRQPMPPGFRQASRHMSISDANLSRSRSSSFHSLSRGSELPLLSPRIHGGGASGSISGEHTPPTLLPKLGRRATRLMVSNRSTVTEPSASSNLRRDSDTGQILAPAIAVPTVASSGSSLMVGRDDALVAPLAMYPTEEQQHT